MRWAVALALCFGALVLARGAPPQVGPAVLLLAVAAIALEATAVKLSGVGFFSAAIAPVVGLALLPQAGPLTAALVLTVSLLVRSLLQRTQNTYREALTDLVSGLAPLALIAWVPSSGAMAVLAYLPFALFAPERILGPLARVPWQQHRELTGIFIVGAAALGPVMAGPQALFVLPVLMALHRAARLDLIRLELLDRERLEESEKTSRETLERTRTELTRATEELGIESNERRLLQEIMTHGEDRAQLIHAILESVKELIPRSTPRLYLDHAGPELAQRCWETGRVVTDESGAALPMQGVAVLFVGRPGGKFDPEERHVLATLAGAGGLGMQSVLRFEDQARTAQKLQVWIKRQAYLLEGARQLASGLNTEEIRQRLEELLQVTLPHQGGCLYDWQLKPVRTWGMPVQHEPAREPVLHQGLMAAPLLAEDSLLGVVALQNDEPFTKEQADVLQTLAYQAAVALENADTHEQLKESQAQLVQSSKMAAVGQLAAGVAHELNTPLGTVLLGLGAVLEKDSDPILERARTAAERAREIVAKLLYYSREGRQGRVPTDLNEVIRDTLDLLGSQLRLDGVQIELDLEPLPTVIVNRNEMQQVLTNLLINARDAVRESPKRIVRVRSQEQRGALVEVLDEGLGVPPQIAERVFDPFFTTKPVGQGTGLGLSTSLQLVVSHGGKLELGPGPGGHFRLWLPGTKDGGAERAPNGG